METSMVRTSLGNGIHFGFLRDTKFTTNRITINLLMPLSPETAAEYALLPLLLRKRSADYTSFTGLNRELSRLYGAKLSAYTSRFGDSQSVTLGITSIDDRFSLTRDEDVAMSCARLLCSLMFNPLIVNGGFLEEDIRLEKAFLIDTIESEINDKRSYARRRCEQNMFKGEAFGTDRHGTVETVTAITPQSAYSAYLRLLQGAAVEIFHMGCSGDGDDVRSVFTDTFKEIKRDNIYKPKTLIKSTVESVKEITESIEVNQGKLVMGYRAPGDPAVMRVFSTIFGGGPYSRLFLNVREKMSLCYYCGSRYDRHKGVMFVESGIEEKNKDKALDEISRQLKVIADGGFTDEELHAAKLSVCDEFRTALDSQGAMELYHFGQTISHTGGSIKGEIDSTNAVTRKDVENAAKSALLDTVYFLKNKS